MISLRCQYSTGIGSSKVSQQQPEGQLPSPTTTFSAMRGTLISSGQSQMSA
jgi:hypothetical protein